MSTECLQTILQPTPSTKVERDERSPGDDQFTNPWRGQRCSDALAKSEFFSGGRDVTVRLQWSISEVQLNRRKRIQRHEQKSRDARFDQPCAPDTDFVDRLVQLEASPLTGDTSYTLLVLFYPGSVVESFPR
ncbi:hypothetical protein K0M31_000704 [Melipona bicolor]|uniref:Uncharacterized protein n=1 Tax=Melipona bicolor TaxID=60889 RepID=A0AA40GE23_9HYME|nr:hypothetical protein K0M31_000704 [Melipona bicolor]